MSEVQAQWLLDYVGQVGENYQVAVAQSQGEIVLDFRIGGDHLQFRGVDRALLHEVTRAFAHLALPTPSDPCAIPDLTIACWSGSGQSYTPASPLHAQHEKTQATSSLLNTVSQTLAGQRQAPILGEGAIRCTMQPHPNRLELLDAARGVAYYWVEEAHLIPPHEKRLPLRSLMAWWFGTRRTALVHGGGIGLATGGVLLVGDSGVGKSSTTIASLNSPLRYAGDDYCLVALGSGSKRSAVHLHSLYSSMQVKQRADLAHHATLGNVRADQLQENNGKHSLYLNEIVADNVCSGFPLRAILLPHIRGQAQTQLRPATPSHCLSALAPSTVRQMPTVARETLPRLARLVEIVPAFHLELGTVRQGIAPAILELLASLPHDA